MKRTTIALGSIALVLVAFLAGAAVAQHRTLNWAFKLMQQEIAFTLDMNVQQLAYLRAGEPEQAISLMEDTVDRIVVSLDPTSASPPIRSCRPAKSLPPLRGASG